MLAQAMSVVAILSSFYLYIVSQFRGFSCAPFFFPSLSLVHISTSRTCLGIVNIRHFPKKHRLHKGWGKRVSISGHV